MTDHTIVIRQPRVVVDLSKVLARPTIDASRSQPRPLIRIEWAGPRGPAGSDGSGGGTAVAAANVILQAPSLTPEVGDLVSWLWYLPGVPAQPDATPPVPANFNVITSWTWSGSYVGETDQHVLLMLPEDDWPSTYAHVTPDGFVPVTLLGGTPVTVGCATAGFGPNPTIWVGGNFADPLNGGLDPREPSVVFTPPSWTSAEIWPINSDGGDFTGHLAGTLGNNLSEVLHVIDEFDLGGGGGGVASVNHQTPDEDGDVEVDLPQFPAVQAALDAVLPDVDGGDRGDVLTVDQEVADHTESTITTANNGASTLGTVSGRTIAGWSDAPNNPAPFPLPTTAIFAPIDSPGPFDIGITLGAPPLPVGFTVDHVEVDVTINDVNTQVDVLLTQANAAVYPGSGEAGHAWGTLSGVGSAGDYTISVPLVPPVLIGSSGDDVQAEVAFRNLTSDPDTLVVSAVRWIGTALSPKHPAWLPPAEQVDQVVTADCYSPSAFAVDGSVEVPPTGTIFTFDPDQTGGPGVYTIGDDNIPRLTTTITPGMAVESVYTIDGTPESHIWYMDHFGDMIDLLALFAEGSDLTALTSRVTTLEGELGAALPSGRQVNTDFALQSDDRIIDVDASGSDITGDFTNPSLVPAYSVLTVKRTDATLANGGGGHNVHLSGTFDGDPDGFDLTDGLQTVMVYSDGSGFRVLSRLYDNRYTYTQSSPSSTWTINHNLGRQVEVEVYETSGRVVEVGVQATSDNQIVVSSTVAFAGYAVIN